MSDNNHPPKDASKWITAYNTMMKRVASALQTLTHDAEPRLHQAIDIAKDKASELGELTREEADKVAHFLKRDVEDAAGYLAGDDAADLGAWLRFDIERAEETILESFFSVADQTKLDLLRLQQQAEHPNTYHTGEMTSIGTLICTQCGKLYHFHETGHIPPCNACHNTMFERVSDSPDVNYPSE